jgi:hypothetical protein
MGGSIAGLEHGVLFAVADSLRRLALARELWGKLVDLQRRSAVWRILTVEMPRFRVRRSLLRSWLYLAGSGVSELEALQAHVDEGVGLARLLERLRSVADLLDQEIRSEQAFLMNVLLVILTGAIIIVTILHH